MKIGKLDHVENVYELDVMFHGMPNYCSCYMIDCDGVVLMCDTGQPAHWKDTMKCMKKWGFRPNKIDYLFIGHDHVDHFGAAAYIVDQNPNVTIYCSYETARFLLFPDEEKKERATTKVHDWCRNLSGYPEKVPAKNIRIVDDDEILDINGHRFKVYYTPGHRPGNLTLEYLEKNIVFTGDTCGNCFVDCGAHYALCGNGVNYFQLIGSLKLIQSLKPDYIALGHAGITDDPEVLQDSIDLYQDLLDDARDIMEENQGPEQEQLLFNLYKDRLQEGLEVLRKSPLHGEECYQYAAGEHTVPQCKRFAEHCMRNYYPELAYKG